MLILGGWATKKETDQLAIDFSGAYALDSTDSFNGPPEAGSNRTLLRGLSLGLSRRGEVRSRFLSIERGIF